MTSFLERMTEICQERLAPSFCRPLLQYLMEGKEDDLEAALSSLPGQEWEADKLITAWELIGGADNLSEVERRGLRANVVLDQREFVNDWLDREWNRTDCPRQIAFDAFRAAHGTTDEGRADLTSRCIRRVLWGWRQIDQPVPEFEEYLLSLPDAELAAADTRHFTSDFVEFLCRRAPERLPALAPSFLTSTTIFGQERHLCAVTCWRLLSHDVSQFEPIVLRAIEQETDCGSRFRGWEQLAAFCGPKYRDRVREAAIDVVCGHHSNANEFYFYLAAAFGWLIREFGAAAIPDVTPHLTGNSNVRFTQSSLKVLIDTLGQDAVEGVVLAVAHPLSDCRLLALSTLADWNRPVDHDLLKEKIEAGLGHEHTPIMSRYVQLAGRWNPEAVAPALWKLFEHKSKPVRAAVARALGRAGESAVLKGRELLESRKSAVRSAAVTLLATAQSDTATTALEARLNVEPDDEVRDQILQALERVWEQRGQTVTRSDIEDRITRSAEKLREPVTGWLQEASLPALSFLPPDGNPLPQPMVRYLLYRQSRAREMRPDIEAKPVYALINRATSGDFALELLQQYLRSPMSAEDRWVLVVSAILGDDRLVPVLMNQIRKWVESSRGKLAEYATQALALLGTDLALSAVDTLSIRYRSKQKNIGKAACEAFAEAAERLGITADELGDRVVPTLGFEPGRPRLVTAGKKTLEARINLDFKLEYRDLDTGKKVASLPASVSADIKGEFKSLSEMLREVQKGQLVRLENLMVRQFRWPVGRWLKLFLHHPVLFPFAVRLVWGQYGAGGQLLATFRVLDDQSLTNESDQGVQLSDTEATVGIVHPLELTPEQLAAWRSHLADHAIEPPFPQLERPVVHVTEAQRDLRISGELNGNQLNGMTFKGRAERLGWQRGAVADAGFISSYRKCYAGGGIDAILRVEGMFIGMGMEDSITLEDFCFVHTGTVTFGSYTYDEPENSRDSRLIPFGDVPPIVFSETMGDLQKIAAGSTRETTT